MPHYEQDFSSVTLCHLMRRNPVTEHMLNVGIMIRTADESLRNRVVLYW